MSIYQHDGPAKSRLEVRGALTGPAVRDLELRWLALASTLDQRTLIVDLSSATETDEHAEALLVRMRQSGARIETARSAVEEAAGGLVRLRQWLRSAASMVLVLMAASAWGAELKPESVKAWDAYTAGVESEAQQRISGSLRLLWIHDSEDRRALLDGRVVARAAAPDGRVAVSGALIHDWCGAVFVPGVGAERVLAVLDQYDRYRDFYAPEVSASHLKSMLGNRREYSMRWVKRTAMVSSVIDADYESRWEPAGPGRWWSVSRSTRVQEVEDGHLRPAGTGAGFVWSVSSIMLVTNVEGGAIVEVRALVLSREVPAAAAWIVNPFVSRLARHSVANMLKQTRAAVLLAL